MAHVERPLSPHLQVYRPQISSTLSILHRITGVGLGLGAAFLACWLIALASGPDAYYAVQDFAGSILGRLLLLGFTWAFFYHLANGIRHLGWDLGYGFELKTADATGWAVVAASGVLTILAWVLAYAWRA
jgi:succinate dehydrogenase / fumarate reductase, cytochrome b subunit